MGFENGGAGGDLFHVVSRAATAAAAADSGGAAATTAVEWCFVGTVVIIAMSEQSGYGGGLADMQ